MKETVDVAIKLLTPLANTLGTTVEYLWGALIKQAKVDFWATTIQYVFIIGAIIGWVNVYKWVLGRQDDDYFPGYVIGLAISGGVLLIFAVISWDYVPTYLASLLNPEYWALQKVLKLCNPAQ